jgi:hypothetical protein
MSRPKEWTEEEDALLRSEYLRTPKLELCRRLGIERKTLYRRAVILGVIPMRQQAIDGRIRELHAKGYSDAEIAQELGRDRHTIGIRRAVLGLPCNSHANASERFRQQVAARTKQQLTKLGTKTLAELRVEKHRKYARYYGWPEDLRPRSVQVLNALREHGPMTRRQIADAIGMPWKGSRKSLVSNDPEGSILAHLIARGLVISLGRIKRGKGSGYSVQVYSLALDVSPQRS